MLRKAVKASFLEARVRHRGRFCETNGYPIVYGEKIINPDLALLYWYMAIYDVATSGTLSTFELPLLSTQY